MKHTTIFIIIGIIGNIFLYGSIFWYIYKEKIKTFWYSHTKAESYIRAVFIFPNNKVAIFNTTYNPDKTFLFGEGRYNIDDKKIRQMKDKLYDIKESQMLFTGFFANIPTLFYLYGNPNPLDFKEIVKTGQKFGVVELNSLSYKEALEQKLIRDLMQDAKKEMLILLLVGANLLITLLLAGKVFGVFDKLMKKGG